MEKQLRLIALTVFLVGLIGTAVITTLLFATANEGFRQFFEANARNAQEAVVDQVDTSVAILRGVAGLVASQRTNVTAESFRAYMRNVALRKHYPGIQGIGFTRQLPAAQKEAFEAAMREQGQPDFRIWPDQPAAGGNLHSILFLEPMDDRNKAALGYNMYSEANRREAMAQARDTGAVAISDIVELVQEIDERKQPGFLLYLPIYRTAATPAELGMRREQLLGFSYAPIRATDFLANTFAERFVPQVSFDIYHGTEVAADALLYSHALDAGGGTPLHEMRSTVELAGGIWTFVFRSTMTRSQSLILPSVLAGTGVAFSALLAMLFWREANSRRRIQFALAREQAARGQAERANRMKDQFLATLSHELRTPLTAIVGWAEVLRHGRVPEPQLHAGLDTINRNAKSQARLIDDLLDMSRITSGKISLEMEPVNLNQMLDSELAAISEAAQKRSLHLEKQLPDDTLTVRADPARLQQIFWNLLSNALKFAPEHGLIRVALSREADSARLTVEDNGEGIDPAMLQHIFDHFAQADGTIKRRHGGLGLGLAITRELVTMHGGRIYARSEGKGKGAVFIVDLPLFRGDDAAQVQAAAEDESLEDLRLLVVDDEDDVRELLCVIVEPHGATALCLPSAREALDAIEDFMPDAIVSDIGMPNMNGYEFIAAVRSHPNPRIAAVPAIALTAYARAEDIREALAAGYQLHMTKPVRPDKLRIAIRSLLDEQEAMAIAVDASEQPE